MIDHTWRKKYILMFADLLAGMFRSNPGFPLLQQCSHFTGTMTSGLTTSGFSDQWPATT